MTDQTAATECAFADEGCTCGRPRLTLAEAQARRAAAPQPGPTFATYLDAAERDQLDARAATAEAERDDALNDRDAYREARDVLRKQLDAMKAAKKRALGRLEMAEHVIDLIRGGQEQIDRALAVYDTTPGEACSPPCTLPKGHPEECDANAQPSGLGSPADRAQDQPEREEVRWAYRWIGRDGQVYDEMDANDNAMETAEQRAHRIAARHLTGTVRGEVIRYRVLTMPAEVVTTYPFEEPA